MGLRQQFQVKWQVWIQQLNTYLIHCDLKWALSPGWKDEGWWTPRPCLISFVITPVIGQASKPVESHRDDNTRIFSHAANPDKEGEHYSKWWPAWIPTARAPAAAHVCALKGIVCCEITRPDCFKDIGSWTGNKNLCNWNSTPSSFPNAQGKKQLVAMKRKKKSNKKNKCQTDQTWLLRWNSHRHQKANSNYGGGGGGGVLPKLCRHRDRKQSCDSSVHTQCKLYRGLSPCEHIRHNTAIHHSRQACQIERGQVFLFRDDVLTLFFVSILTNLPVHSTPRFAALVCGHHYLHFPHLAQAFAPSDLQWETESSHYATQTYANKMLPQGPRT